VGGISLMAFTLADVLGENVTASRDRAGRQSSLSYWAKDYLRLFADVKTFSVCPEPLRRG